MSRNHGVLEPQSTSKIAPIKHLRSESQTDLFLRVAISSYASRLTSFFLTDFVSLRQRYFVDFANATSNRLRSREQRSFQVEKNSVTEHLRQVNAVGHPVSMLFGVSRSTFRPSRRPDLFGEGTRRRQAYRERTACRVASEPTDSHSLGEFM